MSGSGEHSGSLTGGNLRRAHEQSGPARFRQWRASTWIRTPTGRVVVLTMVLIIAWLALVFVVDPVRFVLLNPRAKTGFEVFLAIGQIFGALILALAPVEETNARRMHWVAAGFFTFGIGAIAFGYLYPLLTDATNLSVTLYGSIYVRTAGSLLIAIGLVPAILPRLPRERALIIAALVGLGGLVTAMIADDLPPLIHIAGTSTILDHNPALDSGAVVEHAHLTDVERVVSDAHTVFPGLTAWHWGVSLIPLAAAALAACGALREHRRRPLGTWLLVAIVLLVGAQLHSLFWPAMYSSILTTTSVLRLGVAAVVIAGGVLELLRVVDDRAVLLAAEREQVARMEELASLKADFTALVAHELATPLATISTMSEMLATGSLSADQGKQIGEHILDETRLLNLLVADVRASADVERDDFHIQPQRISVASLLAGAEVFARTLPGTHPITIETAPAADILADPDRVGQVLRNLIANSIRHTPAGTPIVLRAIQTHGHIRFEVADRGPGIPQGDHGRIFEKFGRGRDTTQRKTPGRGLGLYLSRCILLAHGTDLRVDSSPDRGTTFWFTLEKDP